MKATKFITTPLLGELYHQNIYSFYLEPLIFTAFNNSQQLFFCYSLGDEEQNTKEQWLIVPVNQEEINKLEQKEISITKMLSNEKTILVEIDLTTGAIEEKPIQIQNSNFLMPEDNITV